MNNVELALMVSASYLFFLWFYGRLRILRGRELAPAPSLFRRLDRAAVLRELGAAAGPEGAPALLTDVLGDGHAPPPSGALDGLPENWRLLASSAVWALAAERATTALARYEAAARCRREARKARRVAPGVLPDYLELHVAMAFLTDPLNLEWMIFKTGRSLTRALSRFGPHPLLHLLAAHRSALSGEAAECVAELARAFFHARDDRYIAELIVASPVVAERSPALVEQAQRALAGAPPSVQ
jgi:hypothetical protein